jgi:hypothetical protein
VEQKSDTINTTIIHYIKRNHLLPLAFILFHREKNNILQYATKMTNAEMSGFLDK